tara:strand:+ start:66 stop:560 length:495 start_codon:yes stop_codon:yes gene_type:complete
MDTDSLIVIGKIINTHGIKGWVSIQSYSYPKENIKNYKTFLSLNGLVKKIEILDLRTMPKKIIININKYESISQSETIVGQDIFIDKYDIPTLENNEYYWKDLEGLDVITSKNKYLGKVDFIFNNGANDVIALKDNDVYNYIALVKEYVNIVPNEKIIVKDEYI